MSKRKTLLIILYTWLVFGLPTFGIIPLSFMLFGERVPNELLFLDWAFLRGFFNIFFLDPEPGTMDVPPQLTKRGWWAMIIISFAITAVAIRYFWFREGEKRIGADFRS